jgi:hypothetical protein
MFHNHAVEQLWMPRLSEHSYDTPLVKLRLSPDVLLPVNFMEIETLTTVPGELLCGCPEAIGHWGRGGWVQS